MVVLRMLSELIGILYVIIPILIALFKSPLGTFKQIPLAAYKILNTPIGATLMLLVVVYHAYCSLAQNYPRLVTKKEIGEHYYIVTITFLAVLIKMFYI